MSTIFAVVASAPGFPADCSTATATVTLPAITTTLTSSVAFSISCPAVPPITIQKTVTPTTSSTCPSAIPTNPSIQGGLEYVLYYSGSRVSPTNKNPYVGVGYFRADLGPSSALQACIAAVYFNMFRSFHMVFRSSYSGLVGGGYEYFGIVPHQSNANLFSVEGPAASEVYAYTLGAYSP